MKREIGDQMFFDDLPEEVEAKPETLAYERDDCGYCQDGGTCIFCDRGRQYIKDHPELTKKKKKAA